MSSLDQAPRESLGRQVDTRAERVTSHGLMNVSSSADLCIGTRTSSSTANHSMCTLIAASVVTTTHLIASAALRGVLEGNAERLGMLLIAKGTRAA